MSEQGSDDMTNVLFLLGRFGIGGVERVTIVLAAELVRRGYGVTICAFEIDDIFTNTKIT